MVSLVANGTVHHGPPQCRAEARGRRTELCPKESLSLNASATKPSALAVPVCCVSSCVVSHCLSSYRLYSHTLFFFVFGALSPNSQSGPVTLIDDSLGPTEACELGYSHCALRPAATRSGPTSKISFVPVFRLLMSVQAFMQPPRRTGCVM